MRRLKYAARRAEMGSTLRFKDGAYKTIPQNQARDLKRIVDYLERFGSINLEMTDSNENIAEILETYGAKFTEHVEHVGDREYRFRLFEVGGKNEHNKFRLDYE